jgi:hypothetical protein
LETFGQEMLTSMAVQPGRAAQPVGQLGVLLDAPSGDRHDGPCTLLVQPWQVVVEEVVDAGDLAARSS